MTWLAWVAVSGPCVGLVVGLAWGWALGRTSAAEEVGKLKGAIQDAQAKLDSTRAEILALAAAPPTRSESVRVLELVPTA